MFHLLGTWSEEETHTTKGFVERFSVPNPTSLVSSSRISLVKLFLERSMLLINMRVEPYSSSFPFVTMINFFLKIGLITKVPNGVVAISQSSKIVYIVWNAPKKIVLCKIQDMKNRKIDCTIVEG